MPSLATETERRWTGGQGAALAGTLMLPDVAGPAPAVLLIQGSGPTDRDGNQRPHLVTDLMKQLAALLAGCGVASLRYDKRGMGAAAASLPRDPEALADFVRWESFVDDAQGALAALRGQAGIDAARVGILGHSEGGLIALDLAANRAAAAPAMLVLAATPGRPVAAVLRDQLGRLARSQGASAETVAAILAENDRIVAQLAAGGDYPPAIHPGLAALYPAYLRRFWNGVAALDPAALARACPCPVLVLSGAADVQVTADGDTAALAAALALREGMPGVLHRVAVLDGASHNLKAVAAPADPGFAGPLHPRVRPVLAGWLATLGWTGG